MTILFPFVSANNVWFEHFRQQLTAMRNEYLALSSQCLEGGEAAAIDFILNRHVSTPMLKPDTGIPRLSQRVIFRSTNPMIVTWSETYLRTSLTNAFATVRASPPNVSQYLVEPAPPVERRPPVVATPPPAAAAATSSSSQVNRTDRERQTATPINAPAAANATSLQGHLPEVCPRACRRRISFHRLA